MYKIGVDFVVFSGPDLSFLRWVYLTRGCGEDIHVIYLCCFISQINKVEPSGKKHEIIMENIIACAT